MKVLIAGWFSFSNGHATAGDLISRDLVCEWLRSWDIAYNVANELSLGSGVDWRQVRPGDYSHVVFVCGPFARGELEAEFLSRFAGSRLIGLNLSMGLPLEAWNPFDFLIERDSTAGVNADLVFAARQKLPPVVGICLVEDHPEAAVDVANVAISRLIESREMSIVRIDTRLDVNEAGLRSPGEIEALIARMDTLITTRLHGLVMALKNGVPVVAIDAVPGGGKITRQCARAGWTNVHTLDQLDADRLVRALDYALAPEARDEAAGCAVRMQEAIGDLKGKLEAALNMPGELEVRFRARQEPAAFAAFKASLLENLPAEAPSPHSAKGEGTWGRLSGLWYRLSPAK